MPYKLITVRLLTVATLASVIFLFKPFTLPETKQPSFLKIIGMPSLIGAKDGFEEEDEEKKQVYNEERARLEFEMLRNPVTGTIPENIREIELAAASKVPDRNDVSNRPAYRGMNQNTYQSSGPDNIAGRSRTVAFDSRNPNIMLSGGTQGGIFRSTNGGTSWTFVSPVEDIRSATSIAQDPTQPDTWYCGTGEAWYPASSADVSNGTLGYGIWKSTNNGVTWTKLPATVLNNNEHAFDNPFDLVYRIAVQPTTGHVYAAVHRRIMRSKDRGATWEEVLGSTTPSNLLGGMTDVILTPNGSRIFAAVTGENPVRTLAGVWTSANGDANTWTRIAGGTQSSADSVAGWQPYGKWGRIVLALNGNNTQLLTLYKNGQSASGDTPKPEADLFRADISSGNPAAYTWTNLNSYVPDEPDFNFEGIDPYTTQFNGFNMSIEVKPDNSNILFIGGTAMHRVDLTKTVPAQKFRRIGGYGRGFFPNEFIYPDHHPDIHVIKFLPGSNTTMFTASDGGVHRTNDPMADTVRWTPLVQGLQTTHFQHISISPEPGLLMVMGGTQDNGTLVNENPLTSQEHFQIGGGDGASSAISSFTRNGNTWKQNFFVSTVQGTIFRVGFTFNYNSTNNSLTYVSNTYDNITPTALGGEGQWLTLLYNDPDSSEFLFYNSKNKLYRTTGASTVTASSWTELTGISSTIPADDNFTVMDISKSVNGSTKYMFVGTDGGKIYRLANPTFGAPTAMPTNITPSGMLANSYVAGIAINPRNADTVMAVVSNYDAGTTNVPNIFWTGNATSANPTWQILDGALAPLSSQSCEIVVKTTGVEYYVGTSVGLFSTLAVNGNNTQWVREGSGLMRMAIIRSLRNRQRDNIMAVGTHGNGTFITNIGNAVNLNVVTSVNPVVNDSRFIVSAYPTLTRNTLYYTTGSMLSVKKLQIQLVSAGGQTVQRKVTSYVSGSLDVSNMAPGSYILVIDSDDGKYRFVQKIVKQ